MRPFHYCRALSPLSGVGRSVPQVKSVVDAVKGGELTTADLDVNVNVTPPTRSGSGTRTREVGRSVPKPMPFGSRFPSHFLSPRAIRRLSSHFLHSL